MLEGGGVKGIGLVGAISVLEHEGWVFNRVAGTSAGAIVGALVAAGLTAQALHDLMASIDYTRFRDPTVLDHVPIVGKLLSVVAEEGLYQGGYAHDWIRSQLADAGVRTFSDLAYDDPGSPLPPYRLVVNTSDVSRGKLVRLPWDYLSDFGLDPGACLVADAVRASMSIPFFYRPVRLQPAHGQASVLVDGGMLSNFPVGVFDRSPERWPTIGIKLSARQPPNTLEHQVRGDLSLVEAMVGTMTSWYDQMHLADPGVVARTIFVDTTGVASTDFGITPAQQQQLFDNGQQAASDWLAASPLGVSCP